MAEIKQFSLSGEVTELLSTSVALEKELQNIIEKNMLKFFGVTFLASEYSASDRRIDSLGIDENYCPVIFEYKRSTSENVINQGLFYLNWLMDHRADFKLLVLEMLGADTAKRIDWSMPCVMCIAADFTKYDIHAVNEMQRNIKLIRYRKFGNDLILFEHLNAPNVKPVIEPQSESNTTSPSGQRTFVTHQEKLDKADEAYKNLYFSVRDYILSLGDDIAESQLKSYVAFRKIYNFACIEIYNREKIVLMRLSIDPKTVEIENGFTRDVTNIGHNGTGNLEIYIRSLADFEKAKPLIDRAYNER